MNWKSEAANDLINYSRKKESLENIKEQLGALRAQCTSIKGAATDTVPVMGGGSHYEDRILDNMVKRQRLQLTYQATKRLVELVEKGMNGLNEKERHILERFYVDRLKEAADRLADEMGYERRQIYRIRDSALYKFTVSMYGIEDY